MTSVKNFLFIPVLVSLLLLLPFAPHAFSAAYSEEDPTVKRDIAYMSQAASDMQSLDVYLPGQAQDAPVLIFVHGGGWRKGSKDQVYYKQFASLFAQQGFVTVVPNYRLSGVAKHPAQIEDVARAFAWTYGNIREYGGDPDRIFISGHSAGGHLVSLLALDSRYLDGHEVPAGAIKGVLSLSAIYDISKMNTRSMKTMAEPVFGEDQALWKDASPMNHVQSRRLPPFLVLYAQRDPDTLKEQAQAFANALREDGHRVVLTELKHQGHISEMLRSRRGKNPMAPLMLDFLKSLLDSEAPAQ